MPVSSVQRSDRWLVSQRLQELQIVNHCSSDGQLRVDINAPIDILLLRSVVQHSTASRIELLDWLERCWHTPGASTPNH